MILSKAELAADIVYQAANRDGRLAKYANTVAAFLASLAAVLGALAGVWATTGQFPAVQAVFTAIVPFLSALVVRFTKNGISPTVEKKIIEAGERADARDVIAQTRTSFRELQTALDRARVELPIYRGPSTAHTDEE